MFEIVRRVVEALTEFNLEIVEEELFAIKPPVMEARPETDKEVVVALVVVELSIDSMVMVEEALLATIPPARVERPVTERVSVTERVPVAVMFEAVRFPLKKPLPATARVVKGEVVPMPTLPALVILITSLGYVSPVPLLTAKYKSPAS